MNFVPGSCDFVDGSYSELSAGPTIHRLSRMAVVSGGLSESTLCLVEEDIPGASLTEPFESYTVTELSWWLLCRGIGAPKSWKKAQVLSR